MALRRVGPEKHTGLGPSIAVGIRKGGSQAALQEFGVSGAARPKGEKGDTTHRKGVRGGGTHFHTHVKSHS